MPTLKNSRHERFAHFIALGTMSRAEAFRQAGFKAKRADQGAYELVRRPEIASRINALREEAAQSTEHRSIQSITRQELAELLAKVIKAGFSKPEKAGPHDALKASELLTKLCGWSEPERQVHQHQHIHVDAGLIGQLREGYAALAARASKSRLELAASVRPEGQGSSEGIAPEGGQVLDAGVSGSAAGEPEP
jgi:hypothetical protein